MSERSKRFWKGAAVVSVEMVTAMAVFSVVFSGFILLIRPRVRKYKKLDLKIFDLLEAHTNESNNRLMLFFTYFARHKFLIPANLALIGYFLFIRRRSWFSIRIVSIALSSLGLMFLLKYLFQRKRPLNPLLEEARGLSFPSGHAIMSVTFYGLLIYIISQTVTNNLLKWALITPIVLFMQLIGFSRVYLRVHYPSDVIAGNLIGFVWLRISLDVLKRIEDYNKPPVPLKGELRFNMHY